MLVYLNILRCLKAIISSDLQNCWGNVVGRSCRKIMMKLHLHLNKWSDAFLRFYCWTCRIGAFLTPGPLGGTLGLWVWQGMNSCVEPKAQVINHTSFNFWRWSRKNAIKWHLGMRHCKYSVSWKPLSFLNFGFRAVAKGCLQEPCMDFITDLVAFPSCCCLIPDCS